MDIENRPIEGAIITDDSSSSVSTSYHNGTYKLSVGEGWTYYYLNINLINVNYLSVIILNFIIKVSELYE